ncbi:phosphotransferase family protein, partial [Schumannella luteola]
FGDWLALREPGLHGAGPLRATLLTGGLSNLTYRIDGAARPLVLRRPPLGHVLSTAHDMGREFRVQSALHGTRVPVPQPYLLAPDPHGDAGVGAEFYLMEYIDGEILDSTAKNARWAAHELHEVSIALVRTLARLHAVDPESVGLGDFGRAEGFLARQLRRWATQYEGNRFRELPDLDRLLELLGAGLPETRWSSIVHGDYRLDNAL